MRDGRKKAILEKLYIAYRYNGSNEDKLLVFNNLLDNRDREHMLADWIIRNYATLSWEDNIAAVLDEYFNLDSPPQIGYPGYAENLRAYTIQRESLLKNCTKKHIKNRGNY